MGSNDNLSSHSANDYDQQVRNTIPYYDHFHNCAFQLIKVLNPNPLLWLDTGCGTGTMVLKASEYFNTTKFVLSDPSEGMLKVAKQKLVSCNEEKILFLPPTTTRHINWEEKPFDVITAFLSHHYLSEQERYESTKHCYDLLKDDGVYITFENIRPETNKGVETGLSMWKDYQISHGKTEDEVFKHISRFGVELLPISIKKHLEVLMGSGFSTIELFWYSYMQAGFYAVK